MFKVEKDKRRGFQLRVWRVKRKGERNAVLIILFVCAYTILRFYLFIVIYKKSYIIKC